MRHLIFPFILLSISGALAVFCINVLKDSPTKQDIVVVDLSNFQLNVVDGCGVECSSIVKAMAYSIMHEPWAWKSNGYYLSRVDGPSVWIATGEYGIEIGPTKYSTSNLYPSGGPESQLLWRAFKQWQTTEIPKGKVASGDARDHF